MIYTNVLAEMIEDEYLEEERADLEVGLPPQKCIPIIRYLSCLPSWYATNIMPSLRKASRDRGVFEEYISILLREIFMDCSTAAEVIALADKLIYDISTEKQNVFGKIVSDYTLKDLGEDLLFKIGYDGIEADKQKVCRKACEKLCSELVKYIHPYIEGVLNRRSILCKLFRKQCEREGFKPYKD